MNSIDSAQRYFDEVPNEIVCAIFSYLDLISLGRMQRVTTRFQHIVAQNQLFSSQTQKSRFRHALLEKKLNLLETLAVDLPVPETIAYLNGNIFIGGSDKEIKVLKNDKRTGRLELVDKLLGHQNSIVQICSSTSRLFSRSRDNTIRIWKHDRDRNGFTCIQKIVRGGTTSLSAYTDERFFLGLCFDKIELWKFNSERDIFELNLNFCEQGLFYITVFAYSKEFIFSGNAEGRIKIWKFKADKLEGIQQLKKHSSTISGLYISEEKLISGSSDGMIRVWKKQREAPPFQLVYSLRRKEFVYSLHREEIGSLALSCVGDLLFSGAEEGEVIQIHKWDTKLNQYIYVDEIHTKISISSVLCTGTMLLVGGKKMRLVGDSGDIKVWGYLV